MTSADSDRFITVRDLAENAFRFTCFTSTLRAFRNALVQRNLALRQFNVPSAFAEPVASDPLHAEYEALAYCLYFYLRHELYNKHTEVFEEKKIDHEDHQPKLFRIIRMKHALCAGSLAFTCSVGKAHYAMTLLPLEALHQLRADLLKPDAKPFFVMNLSDRKIMADGDFSGSWHVKCTATVPPTPGRLELHLDMKARSMVDALCATTQVKLPPLPEEEDDVPMPATIGEWAIQRGVFGSAPLPRDPKSVPLPPPLSTGSTLPLELSQKIETKSEVAVRAPAGAEALVTLVPAATHTGQDFSSRDGGFNQYVFATLLVHHTDEPKAADGVVLLRAAEATWCDASGAWHPATAVTTGLAFENYRGDAEFQWADAGADVPVATSQKLAVRVTIRVEGEPGRDNQQRARLHRRFPRPLQLRVTVAEHLGAKAVDSVVTHAFCFEHANAPLSLPSRESKFEEWKVADDLPECCTKDDFIFLAADNAERESRHYIACYPVKESHFRVRFANGYSDFTLESLHGLAFDAVKAGQDEVVFEEKESDGCKTLIKALVKRDYPPAVYGLRLMVETPSACEQRCVHVKFAGTSWLPSATQRAAAAAVPPTPEAAAVSSSTAETTSATVVSTPPAASEASTAAQSLDTAAMGARSHSTASVGGGSSNSIGGKYTVMYRERLGAGAFGTVYLGFNNTTTESVAVKQCRIGEDAAMCASLRNEFSLLTQLNHKNIVRVFTLDFDGPVASIVMEWMPSGSVSALLNRTGHRLHESAIRRFLGDALRGLEYLHRNGIIHLDIKPANMLVSVDGTVKLADFGTSRLLSAVGGSVTTQHVVGTPAYMAPEMITSGKFYQGSDMWALACSAIEMATGRMPWAHLDPMVANNHMPLMFHIGTAAPPNHAPPIPPHLSAELRKLLADCLAPTIASRPKADELLRRDYFVSESLPLDAENDQSFQLVVADAHERASSGAGATASSTASSVVLSGVSMQSWTDVGATA